MTTDAGAMPVRAANRWGLPEVILGVALVAIAVLMILSALLIAQGYQETIARAESRAKSSAQIVAVQTQWLIEASYQALRRIDDAVPGPDISGTALAGDIDKAVEGLPDQVAVAVYDSSGNSSLASAGFTPPPNVADTEYFAAAQAGTEWNISPLISEKVTGESYFVIAKRLGRGGVFAGVATVHVAASLLADFWASLELGPNSTVSVVRDDGWLVARYPSPEAALNLIDGPLFTQYLPQAPTGTYLGGKSPVDGISRVVGYWDLQRQPVIAIASVSIDYVLAGFWRGVIIFLALMVPVALALLAGAIWLSQLLRNNERARLALAQSLESNQTLFREIHHRVKNNLQAVSSLVQLQPLPPAAKQEMSRRIAAMVSVHEHIYRSDQFAKVDVADYVRTLVENVQHSYDTDASVTFHLEPVTVDKDHAMPLGLIVNEVVSNAFKHAFTDGRKGEIEVSLANIDAELARLTITDNGIGFDTETKSQGMGRRLIDGLGSQLGATYAFAMDRGARFEMTFPIVG